MKVLYTTKEGGILKPMQIVPPKGDIFALYLPDGTIWDRMIGVDPSYIGEDEFERLFEEAVERER